MVFWDASKELVLSKKRYKSQLELYVWQAYLADVGRGDITTDLFVMDKKRIIKAKIIAKEDGVLSGVQEAEWFLKRLKINDLRFKKDGARIKKGDVIAVLEGGADVILGCERTLLNLLQRMSGIATFTDRLARKFPRSIKLLATRKTFWGDLDKRAVSVGGGFTHRLNLGDAVLVKENHIFLNSNITRLQDCKIRRLQDYKIARLKKIRFIEIEMESLDQVRSFVKTYKSFGKLSVAVMLDDFRPSDIKNAVDILKGIDVFIEVSGGINERNILNYAVEGVDAVSVGAITNKAGALDMSLLITSR